MFTYILLCTQHCTKHFEVLLLSSHDLMMWAVVVSSFYSYQKLSKLPKVIELVK